MKELSDQARAALQSLGSVEPTSADEARVREGFERAVGVVLPAAVVLGSATVASSATAAGMSSGAAGAGTATATATSAAGFTALGVGAKVMLFVAAVGIGSVVTVGVQAVVPQPGPLRSVVKPAVLPASNKARVQQVAAPVEPAVVPVEEPVVVAAVEPQPVTPVSAAPKLTPKRMPGAQQRAESTAKPEVVSAPESVPETPELTDPPAPMPNAPPTPQSATTEAEFELVVEAHFPSCDAATEMRTAQAARRLLVERRVEHALFLIGAYQKHCPSGQWSDEAWRVRLSSLCFLGRNAEAASLFEWFASEYPRRRAAIESELRSTCESSVLEHE